MYASAWVFTKLEDANGPVAVVEDSTSALEDLLGPPALAAPTPLLTMRSSSSSLEKIDENIET